MVECLGRLLVAGVVGFTYGLGAAAAHAEGSGPDAEKLRREASETLLRGEFDRARREFEQVLRLLPGDAGAQRDAARAAQAAGEFEYAAEALERAHHFGDHKRDPEVHYLRGEALFTLDRAEEARREHRIAELEIGPDPETRIEKLWLARIYARRVWLVQADRLYESMWPPAPQKDGEVALSEADGHLMNQDWQGGENVLRRYLDRDPKSVRGREMLAWALEAQAKLDGELVVRQSLAEDEPSAANRRDYGRALERAADYGAARDQYGAAMAASTAPTADDALVDSYNRMRYRMTPELAAGVQVRSDPQALAWHAQAGAALPFGTRHQLSMLMWHDDATDWRANLVNSNGNSTLRGSGTVTGAGLALVAGLRSGASLFASTDARASSTSASDSHGVVYRSSQHFEMGASAEVDVPLYGILDVNLHGDFNEEWADAPVTIHEGGTMTGLTGHVFLFPTSRIVLVDTGAQVRRVSIDSLVPGTASPTAQQTLLFAGVDFNLWAAPAHIVRGEVLDDRMARRTYLNDAGVLAYRHYELFTDLEPTFRIGLAPRASADNATLAIRKALPGGRAGFDIHGGGGYDNQRHRVLTQAGGALVLAFNWWSRLVVSYDMARETASGLPGTLQIGWLTYHADI
jgi:tetratricopeptide (TPR) repeat protein